MAQVTHGVVTDSSDLRSFTLYEVMLPPGLELAEHRHDAMQLCAVLEGDHLERSAASEKRLAPGSVLLRRSNEAHANRVAEEEVHAILLDLHADFALSLPANAETACFPSARFHQLMDDLRWEHDHAEAGARPAVEALLILLAIRTARAAALPARPRPAWLDEALRRLHARFTEPVRLGLVAASVGVSPARLATAFRRHLNTSLGEYLTELRLEFARRELLRSRRKISEIALDAGFYDESHLGRAFRRRYGIAPGALRRAHN